MKRKLISSIAAISLAVSSAVSLTSSASGTPRDPNGDGAVNMADAVFITQHLVGSQHPSNLTPLDIDQNGIISQMDSYKLQHWCLDNNFPIPNKTPNDPVESPNVRTTGYRRHNYNNGQLSSYTSYSLTTTLTPNNAVDMATIYYPNDMVRDYDTSIVRINNNLTGFIVGDHIIATAAENVYDRNTSKFKTITVDVVGANNNVIETLTPHYAHIPTSYAAYSPDYRPFNYALIYVDEDISSYGKLKMGEALSTYSGQVVVSGFPDEYPNGYSGSSNQIRFRATGNVTNINSEYLYYNADSTNSESGAPVYVEEGVNVNGGLEEYKTVVAIHSESNHGIKVNGNILKFYYTNNHLTS